MAKSISNRFKGAVVGAVIGDCLGAQYEGLWNIEVKKVVKFFTALSNKQIRDQLNAEDNNDAENELEITDQDTKEDNHFKFTDDTAMARSVAYSLTSLSKVNSVDLAKRFVTEFKKEPWRGYGGSVGLVFSQLEKENYKEPFGPASRQFDGSGSFGNGGAMRIVPAALYCYNMEKSKLLDAVDDITKVTHTHPDALNGARLQCTAVHIALHLQAEAPIDVQDFIDQLLVVMKELEKERGLEPPSPKRRAKSKSKQSHQPYCEKLNLIKDYLKQEKEIDRLEIEEALGNDVSALGSVPAAIFSFLRAVQPISDVPFDTPFERAIVYAVTLGGDTDTIATMAGAMAGAYYGIEDIPKHWRDICEGVDDAVAYGEKLYNMTLTSTAVGDEEK